MGRDDQVSACYTAAGVGVLGAQSDGTLDKDRVASHIHGRFPDTPGDGLLSVRRNVAEGGLTTGALWRRTGKGFYALMAVGTFVYLDITDLLSGIGAAASVRDFLVSELLTFLIDTAVNFFWAMFWPVVWLRQMGVTALYWAGGGYAVWVVFLAVALDRREKALRQELDI